VIVSVMTTDKRAANALFKVLEACREYLPPDGIGIDEAMNLIIGAVDPWPLDGYPEEAAAPGPAAPQLTQAEIEAMAQSAADRLQVPRAVEADPMPLENAVQQAKQWAQEARAQRATVLSILRHFGLPENDWEALSLIERMQRSEPADMPATIGERRSIDANELERIAKARPNDYFLRGAGVLKLIGGIRELEARLREAAAPEPVAALGLTEEQKDELRNTHGFTGDVEEMADIIAGMLESNRGEPVATPSGSEPDPDLVQRLTGGEPWQAVDEADLKEIERHLIHHPSHMGFLPADSWKLRNVTLHMVREVRAARASGSEPAAESQHSAFHHESWWLLESTVPPRPFYFAGPARRRKPRQRHTFGEWTDDANKAVRFPTEDAAKLTIAHMMGADTSQPSWHYALINSGWKAVEHIFDYTPASPVQVADRICRDVAELPDRNSPEDWPEAMLVTHDELQAIVRAAMASLLRGAET
jgi:hypothetical protein